MVIGANDADGFFFGGSIRPMPAGSGAGEAEPVC